MQEVSTKIGGHLVMADDDQMMREEDGADHPINGRARRQARCGRASAGCHEPVGAAGLLDRGRGSEDDPLSLQPPSRGRAAC